MNEAETRAEHIDPALKAAGWGVVNESRIQREYPITLGRIEGHGRRSRADVADYVLVYRNTKLAVVEAKAWHMPLTEGVAQAKKYAGKLAVRFAFATNGQGIYQVDMGNGNDESAENDEISSHDSHKSHNSHDCLPTECEIPCYPTPEELWSRTFAEEDAWRDRFAAVPFEDRGGYFQGRYYQDIAIERVLEAVAGGRERILLTLATGTGKTFIAFQTAWKLFHSRWNLSREPSRRPRILFLADRNILADQAYNAFSAFPEDALVRIAPEDIRKKGKVPKNGSIFFTIFQTFMSGPPKDGQISQREKTLVFCATQDHALAVRDLVNQMKTSKDPNYCARVTANDGAIGEQFLREFQDNEKTIPTMLTTSQKLSTGVDARNIRNIVLMRPINSMIEFKQIIGRGTRLYDGKDYFTTYDFVKAHHHFSDPEWDGEPLEPDPCPKCGLHPCACQLMPPKPPQPPVECPVCGQIPCGCAPVPCPKCGQRPCVCVKRAKVRLADGKARTIQHMMVTSFWHPDGTPMSAQQFMEMLFGRLPEFFKDEEELRRLWSEPETRKKLMQGLAEKGFGREQMAEMQRVIDAEQSDLFDVLAYVAYALAPLTREERAAKARAIITQHFNSKQRVFLDFVLSQYVKVGVDELDTEKLSPLLRLKYHDAISDAVADLGNPEQIRGVFMGFQQYLYGPPAV